MSRASHTLTCRRLRGIGYRFFLILVYSCHVLLVYIEQEELEIPLKPNFLDSELSDGRDMEEISKKLSIWSQLTVVAKYAGKSSEITERTRNRDLRDKEYPFYTLGDQWN